MCAIGSDGGGGGGVEGGEAFVRPALSVEVEGDEIFEVPVLGRATRGLAQGSLQGGADEGLKDEKERPEALAERAEDAQGLGTEWRVEGAGQGMDDGLGERADVVLRHETLDEPKGVGAQRRRTLVDDSEQLRHDRVQMRAEDTAKGVERT